MGRKKKNVSKPTKRQFDDYRDIKGSGIVSMVRVSKVCELSETHLTPEICWYIVDHYEELKKEYGY